MIHKYEMTRVREVTLDKEFILTKGNNDMGDLYLLILILSN